MEGWMNPRRDDNNGWMERWMDGTWIVGGRDGGMDEIRMDGLNGSIDE